MSRKQTKVEVHPEFAHTVRAGTFRPIELVALEREPLVIEEEVTVKEKVFSLAGIDFGKLGFQCKRVGKLDAVGRKSLPRSSFGLPEVRTYPMPDPQHAAAAKSRAKVQLQRGRLSQANYAKIVRKANKVIKACSAR